VIQSYTTTLVEKVQFGKNDTVMTYYAQNSASSPFFCYIRCELAGYKKMHNDFLNKIFATPESYGEVIYKDNVHTPDEKAKEFLRIWAEENNAKPV
jgi:hypothetical protein